MHIHFSEIVCGSRAKIHLYIMDLYLPVEESKDQFATHGKWQLKFGNHLFKTNRYQFPFLRRDRDNSRGGNIVFIKQGLILNRLK